MPTSLKSIYSAGGRIKAIQRGATVAVRNAAPVNQAITAVNMAKTIVITDYIYNTSSNGVADVGVALLSSPTLLLVSAGGNSSAGNVTVYWQVVEYE